MQYGSRFYGRYGPYQAAPYSLAEIGADGSDSESFDTAMERLCTAERSESPVPTNGTESLVQTSDSVQQTSESPTPQADDPVPQPPVPTLMVETRHSSNILAMISKLPVYSVIGTALVGDVPEDMRKDLKISLTSDVPE